MRSKEPRFYQPFIRKQRAAVHKRQWQIFRKKMGQPAPNDTGNIYKYVQLVKFIDYFVI